jgi:transposase
VIRAGNVRVYLALGATDMRKAIDGLSVMVSGHLGRDPFSGHLFAFCNRGRTIIKILYWDRNGFCLWQKRLDRHVFRWPESEAEVLEIGGRDLAWFLDGLDSLRTAGHKRLGYATLY